MSLGLNYRGILGSCRLAQFPLLIEILEMKPDIVGGNVKKPRHFALREPDRPSAARKHTRASPSSDW